MAADHCTACGRPLSAVDVDEHRVHVGGRDGELFFHPACCPLCRTWDRAAAEAIS